MYKNIFCIEKNFMSSFFLHKLYFSPRLSWIYTTSILIGLKIFLILIFSVPLLWTIRPCLCVPGRDRVGVEPEGDPGHDDQHAAGHVDGQQVVRELTLKRQVDRQTAVLA